MTQATLATPVGELQYDLDGSGPPLLLGHAGIVDRRVWDVNLPALTPHYTVIRPDLRGCGSTPRPAENWQDWADFAALLDHLALGPTHVVGNSRSGEAALDLALARPDLVRSVTAVGTVPHGFQFEGEPPAGFLAVVAAYRAGELERAAQLEAELYLAGEGRSAAEMDPALMAFVAEMSLACLRHEKAATSQPVPLEPQAIGRLHELETPLLLVVGDRDNAEFFRAAEMVLAAMPQARLETMRGTAHLPALEQPERFNAILLHFLGRVA